LVQINVVNEYWGKKRPRIGGKAIGGVSRNKHKEKKPGMEKKSRIMPSPGGRDKSIASNKKKSFPTEKKTSGW